MALKGQSEITQGLLSVWRASHEDEVGLKWLLVAATCNEELDTGLDEPR